MNDVKEEEDSSSSTVHDATLSQQQQQQQAHPAGRVEDRLLAWGEEYRSRLARAREQRAAETRRLDEVLVNTLAQVKRPRWRSAEEREAALAKQSAREAARRQALEEEQARCAPSHPAILPHSKRLVAQRQARAHSLAGKEDNADKTARRVPPGSCSSEEAPFRPTVSACASRLSRQPGHSAFDDLYAHSAARAQYLRELTAVSQEAPPFKPQLNHRSSELAARLASTSWQRLSTPRQASLALTGSSTARGGADSVPRDRDDGNDAAAGRQRLQHTQRGSAKGRAARMPSSDRAALTQRMEAWQRRKEAHLSERRREAELREKERCPFRPQTTRTPTTIATPTPPPPRWVQPLTSSCDIVELMRLLSVESGTELTEKEEEREITERCFDHAAFPFTDDCEPATCEYDEVGLIQEVLEALRMADRVTLQLQR